MAAVPYQIDPFFLSFWILGALLFLYWILPPVATLLGLTRCTFEVVDRPASLSNTFFPIRLETHEQLTALAFVPRGTFEARYLLLYQHWVTTQHIRIYANPSIPCFAAVYRDSLNVERVMLTTRFETGALISSMGGAMVDYSADEKDVYLQEFEARDLVAILEKHRQSVERARADGRTTIDTTDLSHWREVRSGAKSWLHLSRKERRNALPILASTLFYTLLFGGGTLWFTGMDPCGGFIILIGIIFATFAITLFEQQGPHQREKPKIVEIETGPGKDTFTDSPKPPAPPPSDAIKEPPSDAYRRHDL